MDKRLFLEQPIITSYPKYAHLFSIIGFKEDYLLWIANHFLLYHSYEYTTHKSIDLSGFDKEALDANPYPNGPCIECFKVPIMNFDSIVIGKMIEKYLMNDFYVCINVKTNHLTLFGTCDLVHPVLISGFSQALRIFYVNDFFPPTSKYRTEIIPYDEILDGLSFNYKYILLYKKSEITIDIKKEIKLLNHILIDVFKRTLFSATIPYNPYYFKNQILLNYSSGLDVYKELKRDLTSYGKKGLHVLYDSKILTYKCLAPIAREGLIQENILEKYSELIDDTEIIRNLIIKYDVNKSSKLLDYTYSKIDTLYFKEKIILEELIKQMSVYDLINKSDLFLENKS